MIKLEVFKNHFFVSSNNILYVTRYKRAKFHEYGEGN